MARRSLSLAGLALVALSASCHSKPEPEAKPSPSPAPPPALGPASAKQFGDPLRPERPEPLTKVIAKPDEFRGKTVTVQGQVRRSCTRKGCWMELAESLDPKALGCRVTFKDYGFFVPTDSAGSHAAVQGLVEVETIKASHVAHLEEEGATFASKAPDGTAKEVQLVATGVRLWR
jgi:hypothetical protein